MRALNFVFFSFLIGSCKEQDPPVYEMAENLIVDSIQLENIQSLSEFQSMQHYNDSTLLSFNIENISANFYSKNKQNSIYAFKKSIDIQPKGYVYSFFKENANSYYTTDFEGYFHNYDSAFKLIHSFKLTGNLPYLKSHFSISHYASSPMIKLGDTVISGFYHNSTRYIREYYKEPSVMEFLLLKDSVKVIKSYIKKPANYKNYELTDVSYCFNNNTLYHLYPQFDTIYSYSRSTGVQKNIAINNRDYVKPKELSGSESNISNDFGSIMKYELENFRYSAIFYNALTKHYILFYYIPVKKENLKKKPTYEDQKRQAIIIDENFKIIQYLTFKKRYFNHANFFFYPGKGLAMPIFKNKTDYGKTTYYIYNF